MHSEGWGCGLDLLLKCFIYEKQENEFFWGGDGNDFLWGRYSCFYVIPSRDFVH